MSGHDLRFAFRQFRKRPGFLLGAVFVLALGIGSSVVVFSVLYQVLLKPLPYRDADRIVLVRNVFPNSMLALRGVSSLDYAELRRHTDVFRESGVYYFDDLTLTGAGAARAR